MRRLLIVLIVLAVVGAAAGWILTEPRVLAAGDLPNHTADVANGERLFWAGGCSSCHAEPEGRQDDLPHLGGGEPLVTPFGTFVAPNISPDPDDGIGNWSALEFVNAMKHGVGDDGEHLYPAFPYLSYQRMTLTDLIDLKGFMDTLPEVDGKAPGHQLGFPFNIRRGLGMWKLLYADGETFEPDPAADDMVNRGAYLVNGPGHCGECHTPRNLIGGPIGDRYLAGGPSPEGAGRIPNITSHADGLGGWSDFDLLGVFAQGQKPFFQGAFTGQMGDVTANTMRLPPEDHEAIVAYLKTVPAVADEAVEE